MNEFQNSKILPPKKNLKSPTRWAALNLSGLSVLTLILTQGSTAWDATTFDPGLESGKWAIRWLIACLTMSPLSTFLGWRSATKLRKSAGLWACAFAAVHLFFYIKESQLSWLTFPTQPFIALGLSGMLILSMLAVTSNRFAMQRLQKNWKRLHRCVYLCSMAVTSHAILATTASKKLAIRDPQSIRELQIYLAVMIVLLAVRLPIVRRILAEALAPRRILREADLPINPVIVPNREPAHLPEIFAIDGSILREKISSECTQENVWDRQKETSVSANLPLAR